MPKFLLYLTQISMVFQTCYSSSINSPHTPSYQQTHSHPPVPVRDSAFARAVVGPDVYYPLTCLLGFMIMMCAGLELVPKQYSELELKQKPYLRRKQEREINNATRNWVRQLLGSGALAVLVVYYAYQPAKSALLTIGYIVLMLWRLPRYKARYLPKVAIFVAAILGAFQFLEVYRQKVYYGVYGTITNRTELSYVTREGVYQHYPSVWSFGADSSTISQDDQQGNQILGGSDDFLENIGTGLEDLSIQELEKLQKYLGDDDDDDDDDDDRDGDGDGDGDDDSTPDDKEEDDDTADKTAIKLV